MSCEHKRLKSVNCVLYCADCGARLDKHQDQATEKKPVKKTAKRKEGKADG